MRLAVSLLVMKKLTAAGIGLMGFIWLLMGCAEAAVTGAMAGGGEYYRHNRYIYFYAETRPQNKMYWGGENLHWFEGKRFGFFKADFGNDSENFTQSFSCD
jgi:hypothetical protein